MGDVKPVLQKPPALRDPAATHPPPPRKPLPPPLPQAFRQAGKPIRRQNNRKPISCCRICFCTIIFVFVLLIIFALFGAICYLYFQPRLPIFRVQSLQAPHFSVTTKPDGSGTFLTTDTVIKIFVSNQNAKIDLSYGESNADVYISDSDGDVPVGSGSVAGFFIGRKNATVLKFTTSVNGVLVDDGVGTRLRSGFRSREIRFGVEVKVGVGVRVGKNKRVLWRVPMSVDCSAVSLRLVKVGRTLPKCDIYFFSWVNLH